jgi:hypothetical protein
MPKRRVTHFYSDIRERASTSTRLSFDPLFRDFSGSKTVLTGPLGELDGQGGSEDFSSEKFLGALAVKMAALRGVPNSDNEPRGEMPTSRFGVNCAGKGLVFLSPLDTPSTSVFLGT